MPEGPELLYFSTLLRKKLKNYTFVDIKSYTNKPVIIPKDFGVKIINIDSKGKLMWFEVLSKDEKKTYYIHIHYGITGWFEFQKPDKNIKFEFIFKNINNDKELIIYLEDRRRFSKINILNKEDHNKKLEKLGIDIFSKEFTIEQFKNIITSKNTLLAALLLNQNIFSGIGNYIKNESLYLTKLNIKIKTSQLDDKNITNLYNNILFVAYSNLYEMLKDSNINTKYLLECKKINKPTKLEVPYIYKIYGREKTIDGKQVYKIKVGGRDSYCIKELC